MFPGHFKITGHSGTEFKHRRAFENLKDLRKEGLKRNVDSQIKDDLKAYKLANPYSSIDSSNGLIRFLRFMPFFIIIVMIVYFFSQEGLPELFMSSIFEFISSMN